jgi:hypothetical protein
MKKEVVRLRLTLPLPFSEEHRLLALRREENAVWQQHAEQARLDRDLTPPRPQAMHLADMAAAMENQNRKRTRGINNRPGTPRPGSLLLPAPQPEPVFDQTDQQNVLEHMDTTLGAATGTIPGFPEIPEDLESFTFDAASFPYFPGYLNSGPPTSPATAFIDNYLNAPASPAGTQGLLGFEGPQELEPQQTMVPEPPAAKVVPEVVPAQAAATGMTTGTTNGTPKPRSPRRSRSPAINPNRLIAPNTPAEGVRRPVGDSTTARSQTPDARAASPEEEKDVNAVSREKPRVIFCAANELPSVFLSLRPYRPSPRHGTLKFL